MTKACAVCGREFEPAAERYLYCSKACSRAHWAAKRREERAAKRKHYERVCVVCGAKFETHRKDKVCCSRACYKRRNRQTQQALRDRSGEVRTVVCATCGKPFETTRGDVLYCSKACRYAKEKARRAARLAAEIAVRPPRKVTCAACGREFGTKIRGAVKYCPECGAARSRANQRLRTAAWREAHREELYERQRARRGNFLHELVCEICGKHFVTAMPGRHTCGDKNCQRERQHRRQREVYRTRDRSADAVREKLRTNGITEAEAIAVIAAQDSGDRERLWRESQTWTAGQRRYAKNRYMASHGISSFTSCGSYNFGGKI